MSSSLLLQSFHLNEEMNIILRDKRAIERDMHSIQVSEFESSLPNGSNITCFMPAAVPTIPNSSGKCEYSQSWYLVI